MTTPNTVDALAREISRWNFDATDTQILVCKDQHDKGDPCEYEPLHPVEAVRIIDELRCAVLEASARALAAIPAEPVAWAAFAKNGNIQLWSTKPPSSPAFSETYAKLQPLYTTPQQAGGVPAGFVAVPVEPTPEMLKAGVTAFQHAYSEADILSDWRACFKAMLAAAPTTPVQPLSEAQCNWVEEDPERMPGTYRTACGHLFAFTEGSLAENQAKFCQYCGGGIVTPKEPT